LVGSSQVGNKALGHPHISLRPLVMWPNMQHNNFTNLISHKHVRSIKIMIRHMGNMRSISMRIRNIVTGLDALPLMAMVAKSSLSDSELSSLEFHS
jgi:hypothetical protein